jgi:hypothetical protein
MFALITAKFDCYCAITGRLIKQGQDVYYNYTTKICIHPTEYETTQKSGTKTYFERLNKLNTKTP